MTTATLLRAEDLVVLGLEWADMDVAAGDPPRLRPSGPNPRLVLVFTPQHLGEQAFPEGPDPDDPPAGFVTAARSISGPSRLVFTVPANHGGFELTPAGVLGGVAGLPLAVAAPGAAASDHETNIELPWRLFLSPSPDAGFVHAPAPVTGKGGRIELWHTRMGTRTSERPPVDDRDPRGLAVRPVAARGSDDALNSPLNTFDRGQLVERGLRPGDASVSVNRLWLSALGGTLDAIGSWPSSGIAAWSHRTSLGRDAHVRVVFRGALFPLGHAASYIEVTERRPHPGAEAHQAILRKRGYIVVTEPLRSYAPGDRADIDGARFDRVFPFTQVELRTLITPLLAPPQQVGLNVPAEVVFWPIAAGGSAGPVRFTAVCRDRDGHEVVISLPLLFIADVLVDGQSALSLASLIAGAIPLFESVSPSVETGGHPLALAAGAPGRTSFEVHRIQLTAGRADPPDGRLGFHPRLRGLDLEIPALRQMLGAGGVVRAAFADAFARAPGDGFGPENPGELLLTLPNVAVDFSGKADRSGGLVKPSYMADSLSRLNGPVSSAVTGSHDPHQVFDALQAKLFGAVSLADVIGAIEPHNAPRLVTEAPQPGAMPGVVYDWQPPVVSKGIFRAENAHRAATLNVRAAAGSVDCTLQNFTLDLFSDGEAMLRLHFDELAFHAAPQGKPTVVVNLADVEFVGVLGFVEALRSLIPRGGAGGAAPVLDISAAGVRSSLSVGVPDLAFGVFALQNISVEAGFNVPFLDDPVSASFAFCTRDRPFLLAVSGFGGGGYFGVIVDADGVRHLEAAFEFGASLSMNLGVASGGVSVMGGFLFQMQNEGSASLTGYLRISGEVEVLGLVSVSIVLALSLYYDFGTGKCIGRATLVLEIEIGFFSMSVSLECERRFAGSDGDPPFAEVMGPAEGGRGDFPWREYCRAFAAGEG